MYYASCLINFLNTAIRSVELIKETCISLSCYDTNQPINKLCKNSDVLKRKIRLWVHNSASSSNQTIIRKTNKYIDKLIVCNISIPTIDSINYTSPKDFPILLICMMSLIRNMHHMDVDFKFLCWNLIGSNIDVVVKHIRVILILHFLLTKIYHFPKTLTFQISECTGMRLWWLLLWIKVLWRYKKGRK